MDQHVLNKLHFIHLLQETVAYPEGNTEISTVL